jgi:hypothetical protein
MMRLSHHFGLFSIQCDSIDTMPGFLIAHVMSKVLILDAEIDYSSQSIKYTAWSDKHFREVQHGEDVPSYEFIFTVEGTETSVEIKEIP